TMVDAMGIDSLTEPLLKRLLDEASSAQCHLPSLPAQAGLAAVSAPESVIGSAGRIVWWNFSKDTVPSLTIPLLSAEERRALDEVGVVLPDSAMLADCRANRWRRPLDYAIQQLILVCPVQDTAGEELHPHPLWDELLAASHDKVGELISAKIGDYQSIPTITPDQLQIPEPQISWQVAAGTVKPRDKESPSSLETFFGCPLKWGLNYKAFIRGGHSATLPDLVSTFGSLAHKFVEEVLGQDTLPTADAGAMLAGKLFDQKAPQLVATLFQEGMEAKKEDIRNTVVLATQSLLQHLHDAGVGKLTIEQRLSGTFGSQQLQGYADIVLDKPFMVIDLKRSWAKFFKKKMTSGTALQIIIYGWLLKETRGVFPELAYYTLEDQTFLTTDAKHFPRGEEVNGPSLEDVWTAFEDTFNNAWQVIESGLVLCPGNGEEVESGLEDNRLIMEPPCRFCDYDVLCGRRFK
ncbi:MAG: PD-(D/E)XK nuclease family protein, partial [Thermodesulfobacteriota bacterium]|nr:PD-(D/E)XK nuclease family protein [Thermodesulfobacteriota bacterium]